MSQIPDEIVRGLCREGRARILTCTTTGLVNELQRRHQSWPVATAALGRTASIAAMMGAMLKGNDRLTLQIQGDGPLGSILVDADAQGHVRGYVKNPHVHLPSNAQGKLNVGGGVGAGMLYVIRDYGLKELYRGSVELQTGEIAEDFTYYFSVSEQTPSAVGAGVLVETDNRAVAAGGFILQLLPGHTEEDIAAVEEQLAKLSSLTDFLKTGATAAELLWYLAPDAYGLTASPVEFRCSCSRERLGSVLAGLGVAELESMIEEQGQAELVCRFCNEAYQFDREDLEQLLADVKTKSIDG